MKKYLLLMIVIAGVVSFIAASATSGRRVTAKRMLLNRKIGGTTKYTTTAYAASGSSSTTITLVAAATPKPNISYAGPQTYRVGHAITPISPTNTGGAVPAHAYGQVTTLAGDGTTTIFEHPTGITAGTVHYSDNRGDVPYVYVVDSGHGQVKQISSYNGINTIAMPNTGPVSVSFIRDQQALWILGQGSNNLSLITFNANGSQASSFTGYSFPNDPHCVLSVDTLGSYYLASGNKIWAVDGTGGAAARLEAGHLAL